jgi:hypothetical protein
MDSDSHSYAVGEAGVATVLMSFTSRAGMLTAAQRPDSGPRERISPAAAANSALPFLDVSWRLPCGRTRLQFFG